MNAHAPTRYRILDLGGVEDTNCVYATGISDAGLVVGYAYTGPGHGVHMLGHPFAWRAGKLRRLPLGEASYGHARCVNRLGDIGGSIARDGADRPVLWRKARGYRPEFLPGAYGSVTHLLDDGTAVGACDGRAARWKGSTPTLLGTADNAASQANGANRAGVVVGFRILRGGQTESINTPGDRHAALWFGGSESALPELPKTRRSEATAINEEGTVVGWCATDQGEQACVWKRGAVRPLPIAGVRSSIAHAMNRTGAIVGEADGPILWRDGSSEDPHRGIPPDSGWTLNHLTGINASGWICGYGGYRRFPKHYWRAFVLIPTSTR